MAWNSVIVNSLRLLRFGQCHQAAADATDAVQTAKTVDTVPVSCSSLVTPSYFCYQSKKALDSSLIMPLVARFVMLAECS